MKKITALIITVMLLIGMTPLAAYADIHFVYDEASGLYYGIDEEGHALISGARSNYSGALVIPSELGGCPVTAIIMGAFAHQKAITSVVVPEGVTSIDGNAFGDMDALQDVYFPSTLENLGNFPFYRTQHPFNLHIKDVRAFCEMYNVSIIAESRVKLYKDGEWIRDLVIDGDGTIVTAFKFEMFDIRSLTVTGANVILEFNCFETSALENVTLRDDTVVESGVFRHTAMTENPDNYKDGLLCLGNKLINVYKEASGEIEVPYGITEIIGTAFCDAQNVTSAHIPSSVVNFGERSVGYGFFEQLRPDFVIKGEEGSAAQAYAEENGLPFEAKQDNTYSVSFSGILPADNVPPELITKYKSITIPSDTPYYPGWAFIGWNESGNGADRIYYCGDTYEISGDSAELRGVWCTSNDDGAYSNNGYYAVYYSPNGGVWNGGSDSYVRSATHFGLLKKGDAFVLPSTVSLTREGYVLHADCPFYTGNGAGSTLFGGDGNNGYEYRYDSLGSTFNITSDILPYGTNVVYYACWDPTVTYMLGDPLTDVVDGTVGTYTVRTPNAAKEGYTFECWNTAEDGSGTDYYPASEITVTGPLTLYPKWTAIDPLPDYGISAEKIGGYQVKIAGLDPEKAYVVRYATGEYNNITAVKKGVNAGFKTVSGATETVVELPTHGLHTVGVQSGKNTEFIATVTILAQDIETEVVCSAVDNLVTVRNLYGARYVRITDMLGNQFAYCGNSKFSTDGLKYYTTFSLPAGSGTYNVVVNYYDGVVLTAEITVTVPEPRISTTGRIFRISDYGAGEISYMRFATGLYDTVNELKAAPDIRTFGSKYFREETAAFAALDAVNGMNVSYTIQLMFRSGYSTILHTGIKPSVPYVAVEGNSIMISNISTKGAMIDWIRYAPGNLDTLTQVRKTKGSRLLRFEDAVQGVITIRNLDPGTYTLYYLFDSWNLSEGIIKVEIQ
ncbi:MAG: leucine-rich repeat protein [Clostridia bacterium]|nr:leucine-rich repeat protein [Clostridia bacterium]